MKITIKKINDVYRKTRSIKTRSSQKGFTLFVAVVISSLLLSIGLSLSNILLKQLVFSTTGRESQIAFYAADSGAECALYWDRKNADGSTSLDGAFATTTPTNIEILCGTGDASNVAKVGSFVKEISQDSKNATTTFYIDYTVLGENTDLARKACAKVTVSKKYAELNVGSQVVPIQRTVIDSRGYNAPYEGNYGQTIINQGDGCNVTGSIRVIERAVRLNY